MKVLLIDNRDSFTFNLLHAFLELGTEAEVLDAHSVSAQDLLKQNPGLVCIGPGPRGPSDLQGLVDLAGALLGKVPLLGVCLGMQVMVRAKGGEIARAKEPRHGERSSIQHHETGLFASLPNPLRVMRYHSLIATKLPPSFLATAHDEEGQLMAFADEPQQAFGVQFHPESIGTEGGLLILANVLRQVGFAPTITHRPGSIPPPGHSAW